MLSRRTILARRLRRDQTKAEKRLWRALRVLDLPVRFRRQHPHRAIHCRLFLPARQARDRIGWRPACRTIRAGPCSHFSACSVRLSRDPFLERGRDGKPLRRSAC